MPKLLGKLFEKTKEETKPIEEAKPLEQPLTGVAQVDIERLSAKVEALGQAREAFNERLTALAEQLGEIRSMLGEHERGEAEIKAAAEMAISTIKETRPESLLVEVRKVDAKAEALKEKLVDYEGLTNKIGSDMRDLRITVERFRGMESLIKSAEEVRAKLAAMEKIGDEVKRHADKVEDMFSEVEKRLGEFHALRDRVEDMSKIFKTLTKDFDSVRIDVAKKPSREDFDKFKADVDSRLKEIAKVLERGL